ncbi:hypothetical protein [endosymbiont GvMRE of Glomus versiforme]|nr:hypothetical protein [endosymbiont GvMRE of Glomus versiforme]RHZ36150.1 hypothetical protein GvMRE_Ic2g33 [endosymbiont GvMRE of Glomus versiforme]
MNKKEIVTPIMCDTCKSKKTEPLDLFGNKFCEHFPSESFKRAVSEYK